MKGDKLISAKCSDIMGMQCEYIAQARNAHDAAQMLVRHVRHDHEEVFGSMTQNEAVGMEKRFEAMLA